MTDEILRELIEFIQNASPVVWSTLLKQMYVDAFSLLAWAAVAVVVAVVCYKIAVGATKNSEHDDWREEKIVIGYIVCLLFSVIALALSVSAVAHLINPEFYAIRFILAQIGGCG